MAYAPLDVATLAAGKMGVTAPVAYGDNTPLMINFRAQWLTGILIPVLREYGWNAAKKRASLSAPSLNVSAASYDGIANATLTIGAHTLQVGQTIYVNGVNPAGYNGTFQILSVTGTTVTYQVGANPGAYVSGGVVTWSALMDWNYVYALPADYCRVIRMQMVDVSNWWDYSSMVFKSSQQTPEFAVENGQILTNESIAQIVYVARDLSSPPNPPNYDYMIDLLAAKAAQEMIWPVTQCGQAVVDRFERRYKLALSSAKLKDSQEGTPPDWQEDDWIAVRNG